MGCAACSGQNLYTTPRTLDDGDIQVIAAPEYAFRTRASKRPDPGPSGDDATGALPSMTGALHAGLRGGAGGRGEVGLHTNFGSFGIDGKWNAVRTEHFDLALLARLTASLLPTQPVHGLYRNEAGVSTFLQLPVLLGFNIDPLTFVLSPGGATLLDAQGRITQGVRMGAAIQLRITSRFALQPETSWMREVAGPTDMGLATVGLGILFLHQAKYD